MDALLDLTLNRALHPNSHNDHNNNINNNNKNNNKSSSNKTNSRSSNKTNSSSSSNTNNNARPERKRTPIHRCATVEQRIHCETQYFCKHAPISRAKLTRQKNKKIYACLCKNTVFCKGFASAGISDFSVLRGCKG